LTGPVALHGGGEFDPGDEAVLAELVQAALRRPHHRDPIRIAIAPTAASAYDPARSAAHGASAFEGVATSIGLAVRCETAMVVDAESASDPAIAAVLGDADLIYLPGGDPGRITNTLAGSPAWDAILAAHADGAVLAGASAGAMALASWSWAPNGGIEGFRVAPGILVIPHMDEERWATNVDRLALHAPADFGILGIPERTAAITDDVHADPIVWRVVGEGEVRWLPGSGERTMVARAGRAFESRPAGQP
jgi:cyanophycinase